MLTHRKAGKKQRNEKQKKENKKQSDHFKFLHIDNYSKYKLFKYTN